MEKGSKGEVRRLSEHVRKRKITWHTSLRSDGTSLQVIEGRISIWPEDVEIIKSLRQIVCYIIGFSIFYCYKYLHFPSSSTL